MKLLNYKTYGKCIRIKRIKNGENYTEAIIATSENVNTSSTAKLPNCQYNKSSIKTRSISDKAATYYLFHQLKTMRRYC